MLNFFAAAARPTGSKALSPNFALKVMVVLDTSFLQEMAQVAIQAQWRALVTKLHLISGPVLPKKMQSFQMVPIDNQVVVSGGYSIGGTYYQSALYKLGCVSSGCTWQSMAPLISSGYACS